MRQASTNEIKLLRKLNRKKYREQELRFIVEGERAVEQVLENGFVKVEAVFVKEFQAERFESRETNSKTAVIEDSVFDEIADTENTQGVLALCKVPEESAINALKKETGVIVATDAIQDPGNMGTIIRTAAWFGIKAIFAGKGSVDVYHPKVVRSTAGATGSIKVIQGELEDLLVVFEKSGWETLLLDGGLQSVSLKEVKPPLKTIIVVGNEGNGLNEELLNSSRKKIKIERTGDQKAVESLNAAIALSIALFSVSNKK